MNEKKLSEVLREAALAYPAYIQQPDGKRDQMVVMSVDLIDEIEELESRCTCSSHANCGDARTIMTTDMTNDHLTDVLYWKDGGRYFDDEDDALEYFFGEPDQAVPDTLQPCRRVKASENEGRINAIANKVIEYVDENWAEMSCEDYSFGEVLTPAQKARLKAVLGVWLDEAANVVEADYSKPAEPFKEKALAYKAEANT